SQIFNTALQFAQKAPMTPVNHPAPTRKAETPMSAQERLKFSGVTMLQAASPEHAGQLVRQLAEDQVRRKSDSLFLWSTGSTPLPAYRSIVDSLKNPATAALWKNTRHGHLDEYRFAPGLASQIPSFREDIERALFHALPGKKAYVEQFADSP